MTLGKKASLLGLLAASLIGGAAQAGVVAGNEPLGSMYGSWSNNSSGQNFLVQFTLGADTAISGFDLFTYNVFAQVGTGVQVKIRADNGSGAPAGGNLFQFNDTIDSEVAYDTMVDISSVSFNALTLAAGTYWMGVSGLNSELSWVSFNSGGSATKTTQRQLNGDNVSMTPSIQSLAFRVQGDAANAVPEPTSWALAAVALAGLAISRRRAR